MRRILIADSDPHILLLCQDELRDEGYEVCVASNGREALLLIDEDCPDLVVLEIMLPDMSGLEALRIIKGTCRQTPVIFHSTYEPPETCGVHQIDGAILKTHDMEILKKTVRRFLPSHQSSKYDWQGRQGAKASLCSQGACHGYNGN
ncbi:response regulator [Desulfobacca acetoxidans]|uniref:Response regulator receiver protein n=1 Tax=Desulfobacca acetoxidans (strain ATCC 700848 / DSM 11109 / ASRB2) TaxID=880072 RepID=F2NFR2_DESAR|nr:response regulator [Desulfobacca acetoxidans]AEB10181.1 response regulator receiver protein [Desulfobacca acetoxidans DSM 11109]HAY22618.1 response regulator [Desulfobacterales bacterium]